MLSSLFWGSLSNLAKDFGTLIDHYESDPDAPLTSFKDTKETTLNNHGAYSSEIIQIFHKFLRVISEFLIILLRYARWLPTIAILLIT